MTKFKKICALLLVCILVFSTGVLTANAQNTDENVSDKVVKIIQSYTGVVNKMVWRKS